MRSIRPKHEPERLLDTVTSSLAAMRGGAHRGTLVKAAAAAAGVAVLTAGSAAISAFRRRMEVDS
ncbi:MAG TPA: hypothetical protein VKB10_08305 [Gaiellaceae bacterium]|nr:hypothetical protein [Gaiellaceae bacterium]